jgi:hypothetical protein
MRCCEFYEFAAGDDFGPLPESGEVALIAGDEVVGAGCVGALQEEVAVRGGGSFETVGWDDHVAVVRDELQQLQAQAFTDF